MFIGLVCPLALAEEDGGRETGQSRGDLLAGASYAAEEAGHPLGAWSILQDEASRTIFAGTVEGLFEFDGQRWTRMEAPLRFVRGLGIDRDGRLWAGSYGDIGYFPRQEDGRFGEYVSIGGSLPREWELSSTVWDCLQADGGTVFVTEQALFFWKDGTIRAWAMESSSRLVAFEFEGHIWVHHRESGLHQFTGEGPRLRHPAQGLPGRAVHQLIRSERGLIAVSSEGLRLVGSPDEPVAPEATDAFLREHYVASVNTLRDGSHAIGTLKGIAILSPRLEITRIIGSRDGLPSPTVNRAHVDAEGNLWLATLAGFFRVATGDAVARVELGRFSPRASVDAISSDGEGNLWISAGGELLRLTVATDGTFPPPSRVAGLPRRGTSFAVNGPTVLVARHGGIDLWEGASLRTLKEFVGVTVYGFLQLRARPGTFLVRDYSGVALLEPQGDGSWSFNPLARFAAGATSAAEDDRGRVWLGAWKGNLLRLDLSTGALEEMRPEQPGEVGAGGGARVAGDGDRIFAAVGHGLLRADPSTGRLEPIGAVPPMRVRLLELARDRRRLYVAFDRPAGALASHGLGMLELDEDGRPGAWHDLSIPALAVVGTPQALHATHRDGRDTVWLGGSQGLLRLRPDELSTWPRPGPPRLLVDGTGLTGPGPVYAFGRHRLAIEVRPVENAIRPLLQLETQFGDENGWTPAGPQTQFTFSRLSEGTYTFAARVRNPAGQAGEPAEFTFRIAPPWYRTPAAYGGAALLALAVGAGAMRLRERRSHARTAELERLVRERTTALEQANAAKDEFLASMSHEIRNPLNGVVGLSAAIDTAMLDAEGRRRFGLLRHCAAHLATLLEDILDFSRLQSGSVDLQPQSFAPAGLLASVQAITAADSAAAGVPVTTAVAANVPVHLVGDARRLRQVLLNFVTNALKYAGRGTVEVTAWARPAGPEAVELTFAVTDEGPGIPQEEQEKVFTKFERGAAARRARIPGTGMGLAVCRTLAERMGGRVWVESAPGRGATFYLAVPLPVATEPPAPASALDAALLAVRKPALVVDDEDYNRVALSALLGQLGFEVTTAQDAEAALGLVAAGRTFAAVFLDYDLPGMNGPELARRLRAEHSRHGDQPVILATTAYTTVEKRRDCLGAGMDGFVGKPVTSDRLRQALAEAVATRRPVGGSHLAGPDDAFRAGPGPDPLDNLSLLAATRRRTPAEEFAVFEADCARDFADWRGAADRRDAFAAARAAHQLAGRFGFVRAASAATLALELESACASHRWDDAGTLAAALAAEWERFEPLLRARSTGPAA